MRQLFLFLILLVAAPAHAAVKVADPGVIEVESTVTVARSPAEVYAQIGRIGEWWDPAHTFSGNAANLSLELKPGGCLCERLADGGGVEHLRVVYADPGHAIRLSGALGPFQSMPVAGVLTWTLRPSGNGTTIVQSYRVSGAIDGGGDKLAPIVDQVLSGQLSRLAARLGR